MICSFYDKDFRGLQDNASLVVDSESYSLIKRPVELNELSCKCEAFTENIQPAFLVISDDIGNYIYGSLAGVPILNDDNQTEINGTDLKSLMASDIIIQPTTYSTVNAYLTYIFNQWNTQVNQNSFTCELVFKSNVGNISFENLVPSTEKVIVDALEEMQTYLKFYNLYIDSQIDLVHKKVIFTIGKTLNANNLVTIKLWEYGIKNYGKWVASINECQGYYIDKDTGIWTAGYKWILTSSNNFTITESNRDIYPIKRKVITSEESIDEANTNALMELANGLYNESIEIPVTDIQPTFESKFAIYVRRGEEKYKDLPCGELIYNAGGLVKVKIGYRYDNINFI